MLYQLSYTTHHIYLSIIQAAGSHTSLRHTTQSPSALLDLQSGFRISIHFVCCCVTATIQPTSHVPHFPRPYTTTYLSRMLQLSRNHNPSRGSYRFGNYLRQIVVLATLFHVASFHSLIGLVSFDAVSVPPIGFPSVTICQPTCRDCTLHVPRRLWKVRESNPPAHLSYSWTTAKRW